ncbi:hypothetical protein LP420_06900 [Massilia sp. B-10]|nr:hypothetical protein LP420_06900 [Massilia sp. B-10]
MQVMLGPQWQTSVVLLAWLAPVGFIQSLVSSTGTVLMARGSTGLMLRLGIVGAVLQVGGVMIGAAWGIGGRGRRLPGRQSGQRCLALHFTGRLIGVSLADVARSVAPAVAAALLMVLALRACAPLVAQAVHAPLASLLVQVAIGVLAYGAAAAVLLRPQLLSLRSLVGFQKKVEA